MALINIALYQPEIPANTGNIIRLCANSGCTLHLIKPYGFRFDDKRLRRAGLDYKELANIKEYISYEEFYLEVSNKQRIFAFTTKGKTLYSKQNYQKDDILLFGPETRGLSDEILESFTDSQKVFIPMSSNSRSINLSNAVAIGAYEALRQLNFQKLF